MPVSMAIHPEEHYVIEVMPMDHPYNNEERSRFQIILAPWIKIEDGWKWKGTDFSKPGTEGNHTDVDVDGMHSNADDRAAMHNPNVLSPAPKNLDPTRLAKGPNWGKTAGKDY